MRKRNDGMDDARCRGDWKVLDGPHIAELCETIRSPYTLKNTRYVLRRFFNNPLIRMNAEEFIQKAKTDATGTQELLKQYILHYKKEVLEKRMVGETLKNHIKALKLFLEINDVTGINWFKLRKIMPSMRRGSNDRAPTIEELQNVDKYGDARQKFMLAAMVSGGFRLGGWVDLKVKDFEPIKRDGVIVACKVTIYRGEPEEYFTFVSSETWDRLQAYLDLRKKFGEQVTGDSPVIRNQFRTRARGIGFGNSTVTNVKPLDLKGVGASFSRAWRKAGYRLEIGKGRKEFKLIHSFRKFYKSRAEQTMKPINVETLLGHSTGISDSYYRPLETDLLNDYLKAVKDLCIEPSNRASATASQTEVEDLRRMIINLTNRINSLSQVSI